MTTISTFQELNLSPEITNAISEMGFETPSPIQSETLPILMAEPTDFMGLAATGTGKTAAFGLPLLEKIDTSLREVQAIVLCPTRELALQVTDQFNQMGKYKNVRTVPVYGGAGYSDQIRGLRGGAHIVVATPGRLIDHLDRGTIKLSQVKTIVLDEADEMISMGFKEDIERVLELLPEAEFNTWLFSATMNRDVRSVADRFLKEPKLVQVNKKEMLSGTVKQVFYRVQEKDKPEVLCKLIEQEDQFYGLIFCQTKALVIDLTSYLSERGYKVDCLHGDKDQKQRERTMNAFRERKVSILVCTDVACRGIDVKDLTHVVNYSIARELDSYVHRIGRTGRNGKAGNAISLVTNSHMNLVSRLEKMTGVKIEQGKIPSLKDLAKKKITRMLVKMQEVEAEPIPRVLALMEDDWKQTLELMSKEEIAARFMSMIKPDVGAPPREFIPRTEWSKEGADQEIKGLGQRREREHRDEREHRGDDRRDRSDRREGRGDRRERGFGRCDDRRDDRRDRGFGDRRERGFGGRDDRRERSFGRDRDDNRDHGGGGRERRFRRDRDEGRRFNS